MTTHLVWFRADLRIRDNTALAAACREHDASVIAIFLLAPIQWQLHDWAPIKVDFLLRTLRELSTSLANLNIPLLIRRADRFADAPKMLLSLAREHNASALYFNREYEFNESQRDTAVLDAFRTAALEAHAFDDQTILPPGQIRTQEDRPYTVFTPFKKNWIARSTDRGGPDLLPAPRKRAATVRSADPIPEDIAEFKGLQRPDLWPAGEDHAAARLKSFIARRLSPYKLARDTPAINGTSTLSPYLTLGAISPRQCLHAALAANNNSYDASSSAATSGASTWISELIWREFYKHLLPAFPRLSMHRAFKTQTEAIRWRHDENDFKAWCEGRTGVPIVDAAQRQLVQTGWMHNRLRMITAMYLTKDLFIDWRWGEKFFMQNLIDGDLAQNNGGWQWSASTGTDAAPYFRIFNPVSQSRTCDPDGAFIRKFIPELASLDSKLIHEPWLLPPLARSKINYPQTPIADHATSRARVLQAFSALKDHPA